MTPPTPKPVSMVELGPGDKLRAHFERMQDMCARYLEPGPYTDRDGFVWSDGDPEPFAADMIWMLDGPEQREAQHGRD